ncbi:hypothetical protein ACFXO9_14705 [Nocardia tengchongensis]|uniref:hypothetical protein n=1 Tax=Nocardia tengchongensis TaxID=2055889 RepID=UPI003695C5BB
MTRDLPFDDASGADDKDGDAAYRIANGVARVARGGAYVTGGALIAAGGSRGGTPAIDHDSKNVGWSQAEDPQPNLPSPTITFPDLITDSVPQHHASVVAPVSGVFGPLGDYQHGTDAGLFSEADPSLGGTPGISGFHGIGLPDNDTGLPVYSPHSSWSLPLDDGLLSDPEPAQDNTPPPALDHQQPGFGLDVPDFGFPGNDAHLPGMDGTAFGPGTGFGPGIEGAGFGSGHHFGIPGHSGAFDGVGVSSEVSGEAAVKLFLHTEWSVDAHVGPDGVWFRSDLKVDASAAVKAQVHATSTIGQQLDAHGQQPVQGISNSPADGAAQGGGTAAPSTPGAAAASSAPQTGQPGTAHPAAVNAVPAHGSSDSPSGVTPGSGAPGTGSPVAPSGTPLASSTAPVASSPASGLPAAAPVAPAPSNPIALTTIAPAPAQQPVPSVPAAVPPVSAPPAAAVPVAPVTVAQPVAVTPLQTTIQPDAANQPIANLLSHGGPSPLTAPASVAPALFDHGRAPVLAAGDSTAPGQHPTTLANKPVPAPTPVTAAPHVPTPVKADPGPALTVPAIPTKIPGLDDLTKGLGSPSTIAPVTPPVNTVDTDITPKPHTPIDDSGTRPTVPPVTVPGDDPGSHQPTVTVAPRPTAPTVAPTVPSVPDHGGQPTVSVAPAPTVAPAPNVPSPITTPPHVDPPAQVKPMADRTDSGLHAQPISAFVPVHDSVLPVQDAPLAVHDSLLTVHDGGLHAAGLFSGLGVDAGYADAGVPAHGPGDHMLLL